MNSCKVCGKELKGDYAYCPYCGATLSSVSKDTISDVDRIKSVLPLLKNALAGANSEQVELLTKISEQQKVIDETVKELSELKEIIKQNALMPVGNQNGQNGQNGQQAYPNMYPFPYFYPTYMPQGVVYPGQMPMGTPVQDVPTAPVQNDNEIQDAIVVEPTVESEQSEVKVEKAKKEKVAPKQKGRTRARVLSFILTLFAIAGIVIPFVLPIYGELNGMNVIDALVYAVTGGATSFVPDNLLASEFLYLISSEFSALQIAWWAFIGGFSLTILILFVNVLFGFGRIASGKTKGRAYFLDYLSLFTFIISILGFVCASIWPVIEMSQGDISLIFENAKLVFESVISLGYYAVGIAIIARIILSLFVKRTRIKKSKK